MAAAFCISSSLCGRSLCCFILRQAVGASLDWYGSAAMARIITAAVVLANIARVDKPVARAHQSLLVRMAACDF